MTKEERSEYNKNYVANNKERILTHRAKNRLDHYVIYCLPNYDGLGSNYVGLTKNLYQRLAWHKTKGKLNTQNCIKLDTAATKREGLDIEREYHDKGYDGGATGRPSKQ
mgnify:FL=1